MFGGICMVRGRRRRGLIAVYLAVALLPVLGVLALVVDIGIVRDRRTHVQAAADAAALSAAVKLYNNAIAVSRGTADPGGAARAAAMASLAANGYSADNSNIVINIPPQASQSGFNSEFGYAEVILKYQQRRYFSAIFGSQDIPVGARAIARGGTLNFGKGLIALDRHKDKAIDIGGNGGVKVVGDSVFVNSDSNIAVSLNGNASIEASSLEISGNLDDLKGNSEIIAPVHTGVQPIPDPLRYLPEPDAGDYPVRATSPVSVDGNEERTFLPGVYEGGIKITANGFATFQPGIYIMRGGGFEFSGNGGMIAEGVMIYNMAGADGGGITITGNGSVQLTPPTSGTYRGISLFQERSQSDLIKLSGNGEMRITGVAYVPAAEAVITGNGSTDVYGGTIVANSFVISGNGMVTVDTDGGLSALRGRARLVE